MLLWMTVFEICHSSSNATGWHSRGHRLLRVALSEISGLGSIWSLATDTQRILNIRRRISPRWHFWSVAWPNLIKDFLDVQIIQNACFWHWRKFQEGNSLHLFQKNTLDEKYRQLFVRLFVISLLTFRYFSTIVSHFGAGVIAPFFTAPAPAPSKPFRRLRLRLRPKCVGSGGSGSGSASLLKTLIIRLCLLQALTLSKLEACPVSDCCAYSFLL